MSVTRIGLITPAGTVTRFPFGGIRMGVMGGLLKEV